MLDIDRVRFRYAADWVLTDVAFAVAAGAFLGIIGPNGSGKTTLLKVMNGLLRPQAGAVWLNGRPLAGMRRREVARVMAVVPQDAALLFTFTVEEMVLMGRSPHLGRFGFEGKEDFRIARAAMDRTGVLALAHRPYDALSGGEKQRVLIARALAQEPRILLLDEPTAYLDIRHQAGIFDLMKDLNRRQGLTVVAVTHDINLAALYSDEVLLLADGRVFGAGPPEAVVTTENIRGAYGISVLVDPHPATGLPRVTPAGYAGGGGPDPAP